MSHNNIQNATLVMESRGLAPNVRSFTLQDVWSRLYRTDQYFLDMSCHPKDNLAHIQGQVLSADDATDIGKGKIILRNEENVEINSAPIDEHGQFSLQCSEAGVFDLLIELSNKQKIKLEAFSIQ